MKIRQILILLMLICLTSCAGWQRGCSAILAENFETDWIVVQYKMDGQPINCWKLKNVAITNEESSDGIYWKSSQGHLVHVSGWYNRVQVSNGNFGTAAHDVGVELSKCDNGTYGSVK